MTKYHQYLKLKATKASKNKKIIQAITASDKSQMAKNSTTYSSNLKWIINRRESLRQKYGNEYLAIYNNRVCIHQKDLSTLLKQINEKYDNAPVVVDYIGRKRLNLLL
ncbi:MAG TPA: DUF5678 domain-containing protein [Nitrosopumilaceae archaeon]|nr:DUF5678 domain-containing protein [Nitrosopumilaceae archaeon]